jgi:hypothetical protein
MSDPLVTSVRPAAELLILNASDRHVDGFQDPPSTPIAAVLPAGQERGRTRSVPGAFLAGLICPHHVVHARPGPAGGQPGPGRKKGIGTSDPGMIGCTLPEIRRLLVSLVQACAPDPGGRLVLVPVAPATAVPGPAMPLPAARLRTHLSDRRVASSAAAGAAGLVPGAACASGTSGEPDRGR